MTTKVTSIKFSTKHKKKKGAKIFKVVASLNLITNK